MKNVPRGRIQCWRPHRRGAARSAPGIPGREAAPVRATPVRAAPVSSAPGRAASGEAVPGEAVPGEAVPGETVPGETVPGRAARSQSAPGEAVAAALQLAIGLLTASLDSPELEAWAAEALTPLDADGLGNFMAGLHLVSELLLRELQEATGEPSQDVLRRLAIVAEHLRGTPSAGS